MAQETVIDLAPEVEAIATKLIRLHHPELLECTILYRFTSAAASCTPKKCNAEWKYAYSVHVPGCPKAAVNEGPDFRVLINLEEWDLLLPNQQEAKVEHLLSHIGREPTKDEGIRWICLPHPFEDFPSVLERYGLYSEGAVTMAKVMQQLSLNLEAVEN